MTTAFKSIKKGLKQAITHAAGKKNNVRIRSISHIDVKVIRQKIGMTQPEFAAKFGISLGTLRHWERGDRFPHGPALVLLHVIEKESKAVLRALNS